MTKEEMLDEIRFNIRLDEKGKILFRAGIASVAIDEYASTLTASQSTRIEELEKEVERLDWGLFKEARDTLVLASLLDKSGKCMEMADKIDKRHPEFNNK